MGHRTALVGTGNTITIAAATEDSGGTFTLLDYELAPGFAGLPPHRHRREDEAIYVLEGRLLAVLGRAEHRLGPGEFLFLPRGIAHAQRNPGPDPARFLLLLLPAGFERCLHELEALLDGGSPFSPEATAPLLARYGVQAEGTGAPGESFARHGMRDEE